MYQNGEVFVVGFFFLFFAIAAATPQIHQTFSSE